MKNKCGCGTEVPIEDICKGHPFSVEVYMGDAPLNSRRPAATVIIATQHIFYDHHVMGYVMYSSGKVDLLCDGYERKAA